MKDNTELNYYKRQDISTMFPKFLREQHYCWTTPLISAILGNLTKMFHNSSYFKLHYLSINIEKSKVYNCLSTVEDECLHRNHNYPFLNCKQHKCQHLSCFPLCDCFESSTYLTWHLIVQNCLRKQTNMDASHQSKSIIQGN